MKRIFALILALIMACACLSGCGKTNSEGEKSDPSAAVEIDFLVGSQAMYDWFQSYFPGLVSGDNEYGITVNVEFQAEATQILQMKASTNEVPDTATKL